MMTMALILDGLWKKACEADGIDPQAKFVVFAKDNKYAKMHNDLMVRILGERPQIEVN